MSMLSAFALRCPCKRKNRYSERKFDYSERKFDYSKSNDAVASEQALRYAAILLDLSDMSREDYDELLIEQKRNVIWIHFAVRPSGNRRRISLELRSLLQRPKAD